MQIYIKVLAVGNADAIIIRLTKKERHLVILLDGGRDTHVDQVKAALDEVLKYTNKKGPDIIICTHFDFDHIGGLLKLAPYYKNNISQFFMHRTGELLTGEKNDGGLPSEDDLYLGADSMAAPDNDPSLKIALEGLKHERELVAILEGLKVPITEPVADSLQIEGWEEVKLIAPSISYYQELFPLHFDFTELVEFSDDVRTMKLPSYDPCQALDNRGGGSVSAANLNSAILKILWEEGVFLFTGDAGIESFYEIPDYKKELANLFWLKVPHHGSANNLNSDLIGLMQPQIAVISGTSRVSPLVVTCLKKHSGQVDITGEKGDLVYCFGNP